MTDKEFKFDFRWQDRLTFADWEEFENITHYAWEDFKAGGVPRLNKEGKVLFAADGITPLRVLKTDMTVAWIYLVKRTDDPAVRLEDIKKLPALELDRIIAKQFELVNEVIENEKKVLAASLAQAEEPSKSRSVAASRKPGSKASAK